MHLSLVELVASCQKPRQRCMRAYGPIVYMGGPSEVSFWNTGSGDVETINEAHDSMNSTRLN